MSEKAPRVLPDISGHQKLKNMARTINDLAKAEQDVRMEFCKAVAAAMNLVKQESNLSWLEWSDANLRKPDGTKWASSYLYKCAMFGRNPEKLASHRERIQEAGNVARRMLGFVKRPAGRRKTAPSAITIEDEVKRLMFVWRGVSVEAKKRFLDLIAKES